MSYEKTESIDIYISQKCNWEKGAVNISSIMMAVRIWGHLMGFNI